MSSAALSLKPKPPLVNKTHMPYELDEAVGTKARIGLIVLATDQATEYEFRKILNLPGVAFFEARMYNDPNITRETLAALAKDITPTASLILPGERMDVMAFCCTSGTMVIGEQRVLELIRQARPGIACTSPMTGAFAAMKALKLKSVALLTPYVQEINDMMREQIEAQGVAVPVMGSFNNPDDSVVARISPLSLKRAAVELAKSGKVDGVFVSCTSLRVAEVVEEIEAETGLPAFSSNHAMAWHCLRLAGYTDPVPGYGQLYRV